MELSIRLYTDTVLIQAAVTVSYSGRDHADAAVSILQTLLSQY